ncbi:MAG TPA: hypothetical protein VFV73_36370 [Streptosporangiaceae bacterium]|nr:hypothetical protein [Streptosporangiaceae bacterium]
MASPVPPAPGRCREARSRHYRWQRPLIMAQGRLNQVAPGEAAQRFYDSVTAPSK